MSEDIIAKEVVGGFEPLAAGNYQAVCYGVWDIGIQKGSYEGRVTANQEAVVGWEANEMAEDGKRHTIHNFYNLTLGKKANLRRDLTSWRGQEFTAEELKGFSLKKLIGANCMLNVIHNENGKARVSGVASTPKGLPKLTPENAPTMPAWIEKICARAITKEEAEPIWAEARARRKEQAKEAALAAAAEEEVLPDQEIPF